MKRNIKEPGKILSLFRLIFVVLGTCVAACNNETQMKKYFSDLLKEVDKVQIQIFTDGDTLTQTITERGGILIYKEIINGKKEANLKCDSTGKILYYVKDSLRLEAYFSTPSAGSRYDTPTLVYFLKSDIYRTRFTYRAGMGVDEEFYQLKKKKE